MEPQTPPQPPQPPAQAKKGLSPVAWILIGCGGILLLGALAMGACTIFVASKASDLAEDFAENPGRTAAEMIVALNPDVELVETNDENETITFRSKETGEEMTMDWSEIEEGNFSFSSDEGSFEFNASAEGEGAVITKTDADGEVTTQTYGSAATSEIPDWIPMPDSADAAESSYSMKDGDTTSGALSFNTSDSASDVMAFYVEQFEAMGYTVSQSTYSNEGQEGGSVQGKSESRTMTVAVASTDEGTQATISYSDG